MAAWSDNEEYVDECHDSLELIAMDERPDLGEDQVSSFDYMVEGWKPILFVDSRTFELRMGEPLDSGAEKE